MHRKLIITLAIVCCLAGCGWTRQKVADLLTEAGGKQGDPAQAAKSFKKLGEFVADEDPGPPPVRGAAMEAMATIAIDHDYRGADQAAWKSLNDLLASEWKTPHLPKDEATAGGPGADADRAALRARALWNLGRLDSREHIPAAIETLADDAATNDLHRAAVDLLARQSEALLADGDHRAAAVLALAHRLGAESGFEPGSTRHLIGVLVDLPTLVPLLGHAEGAGRVVCVRWAGQLLTEAAGARSQLAPVLTQALRDALLTAATAERPIADQARVALMRWSPAAWTDFALGGHQGRGGSFTPAELAADLATLLPDLDALARVASRPSTGDAWTMVSDGVLTLDERAALAPEAWAALRGRAVARILEQARVANDQTASPLCAAVLKVDPIALAAWVAVDVKVKSPDFMVRYLVALVADSMVSADAAACTRTCQTLAGLCVVPDFSLRATIHGALIGRAPLDLARACLATLAAAENEPMQPCTGLARAAISAAAKARAAAPPPTLDLRPLAVVFRRGLPEVLSPARAFLATADPGLLAELTLAERCARGTADAADIQVLADLLITKAVDGDHAIAVDAQLRKTIDGADEDAALVAAACLLARARSGAAAPPASHWASVQRLAALDAPAAAPTTAPH